MDSAVAPSVLRFGDFELDLGAHRLSSKGQPVHLERRPLELLILLVSRRGQLVHRRDLINRLWPDSTVIDFESGLNTLVRKLRRALGDSHGASSFIETVPGLGYRFIGPMTSDAPTRTGLTIAVMPFENLARDPDLEYLALGLAEDLRASIAQLGSGHLRILGHVSARAFAASNLSEAEIGTKLSVDYVIAGSVRTEGNKLRVNSRLVSLLDQEQIWTASFDRNLKSILGVQRELASAIAQQIRLQLVPDAASTISRRQTESPTAYDLYLRGRHQWGLLSPAGNRGALHYFQRAIESDPSYALAWSGIAQVLSTAPVTSDIEPTSITQQAHQAAARAVHYAPDLSEVQYALGYIEFWLNWNWLAAEDAFRRAIDLDRNNAIAHLMLGHVLSQLGHHSEAAASMRRARELDPFFSHTFALSAQIAYQGRDFEAALELASQAVAINEEGWIGHLQLGQSLAMLGEPESALVSLRAAERLSGGNSKSLAFQAYLLAASGRRPEARQLISSLEGRSRRQFVPPCAIALGYAGLGQSEAALEWLEHALAARDVHLAFLPRDPRWDGMRDTAPFISLLDRCDFLPAAGGTHQASAALPCQSPRFPAGITPAARPAPSPHPSPGPGRRG